MATRSIALRSGAQMPMLGLGTYKLGAEGSDSLAADRAALETALELGYRHIDTATAYHNEPFLGGVLDGSGVDRAELFLTSKLRNADHAEGEWRGALERSLEALRTDYLDLYMIHWPLPDHDLYLSAYAELARARDEGLIRDVGVANFLAPHLDRLVSETGEAPAVDQIEFHPSWHNPDTVASCAELGVAVEAYSPLSRGADFGAEPVAAAASAHGVPASQVVLAWALQQGVSVIPKSANPERLAENFAVADTTPPFELSAEEIAAISALEGQNQIGHDPNTYAGMQR
ncbi:putative oxidoreductase [Dietzia timorensis]|uniref:Putative oxidoreductase n=1 Tax=Dietzia timorensis TaxID=499555 RepID=A0A173LRN7_9ACTN|nr:putative oxidoreductase [Dietzia timorensis]